MSIHQLLDDVLDLARFRVRELSHYSYPPGVLVGLVVLLGLAQLAAGYPFQTSGLARILYFQLLTWTSLGIANLVLSRWLRARQHLPDDQSLVPLLVVASAPDLLLAATAWLPESVAGPLNVLLFAYGLVVLAWALRGATGSPLGTVLLGIALTVLLSTLVSVLFLAQALALGWMALPTLPAAAP